MMTVRVSTLEAFRRWRNDEASTIDDLFHVPETEAMRVGSGLHKALESAPPGAYDALSADGYRYVFDCDVTIPAMQINEFRSSKRYGEICVSGKCDGIIGRTVYDYKTTGFFNSERYLDGYQWRYYLDIFGLDVFCWLVFVISPDRDGTYIVRDFHRLCAVRYGALHEDCARLAADFHACLAGTRSSAQAFPVAGGPIDECPVFRMEVEI